MKKKWTFFGIPALITIFFVIYFLLPYSVFPYDTNKRLEIYAFVTFPYIYVHYAGQHIGILSIYRARAKQRLSSFHKRFDKIYCHVVTSFTLTALNLNNFYEPVPVNNMSFRKLFLVEYIDWNTIAWITIFIMTVWYLILEFNANIRSYPKMLYAISISSMSFVLTLDNFIFAWELVHLQHFFSHFGFCGHIMDRLDSKIEKEKKKANIYKGYAILFLISVTLSIFHYHYQLTGSINGRYDSILKEIVPLADAKSNVRLLILGLFVGLGISHYYYDRLAFRISDPDIGKILKKYLWS